MMVTYFALSDIKLYHFHAIFYDFLIYFSIEDYYNFFFEMLYFFLHLVYFLEGHLY